jgi:hypothetical protein
VCSTCFQFTQAAEPIDGWVVNENVDISLSNPVRSRRTPDATLDATIVNTSDKPFIGPIRLVITVFTPSTVTLNGNDGTLAGYKYFTLVPEGEELAAGASIKTSTMTVIGGGQTAFSINGDVYSKAIVQPNVLAVDIVSPQTLLTIGASPVQVSGTINNAQAELTLNGVPISHQNGDFTAQVELTEGFNTVVARATMATGEQTTDSIVISLDLTPPYLTIESHTEAQIVYSDKITVTGLVNDIVRGTVESAQAKVQVNGNAATVSNRSYAAHNVALTEGSNVIEITGVDSSGNSASIQQTVIYKAVTGSKLNLVSGQDQTGDIGTVLANALAVQLVDTHGLGIAGETVVFRVVQGAGEVGADTLTSSRAVIVTTDANGHASTKFKLGLHTGVANHKVKAKVVGYENEVIFTASASSVNGDKISINSGNNQRGIVGQPLPAPFIVAVSDLGANTVQGARVRFDIKVGEGLFQNGETSYETHTDTDGRAAAQLTLGMLTGIDAQRIEAILLDGPDGAELMAVFSATAFIAAEPGNTSVSGVVLTNQDEPIPGVTVRIEDTDRTTFTDEEGRFKIALSPVGPVHIIVDGSTATISGEYPSLSYHLVTVPGVENPMSSPVYMVKLDTENGVLAGKEDVALTLDSFPGFKLEVAKNSVTFPDGSREGIISVTSVNASKVPMAPPNGMQPQFIVTIQPVGATFSPAAKLTMPNIDGHKPGAQVEMYSYDHDLEEFVAIGLGTVSEDGSVVSSNPGIGVIKAGWHCTSLPGQPGAAFNCPECQKCTGSSCIIDNAIEPVDTIKGNCHKGSCRDGKPSQTYLIDDDDVPTVDTEIGNCFKPSCWRGTERQNIEPDVTDISEEDAKCKFCDGKNGIKDKPDDTEVPGDKCKICEGGKAVPAYDDEWTSVNGTFASNPSIVKVSEKITKALSYIGISESLKLTPSAKASVRTKDCCEQTDGIKEKGLTETEGSVGVSVSAGIQIWGPPSVDRQFDVLVGKIDVKLEFGASIDAGIGATIKGGKRTDLCKEEDCTYAGTDLNITVAPTLKAEAIVCTVTPWTDEACAGVSVKPASLEISIIGSAGYNLENCESGADGTITIGELKFVASIDLDAVPDSKGLSYEAIIYKAGEL